MDLIKEEQNNVIYIFDYLDKKQNSIDKPIVSDTDWYENEEDW